MAADAGAPWLRDPAITAASLYHMDELQQALKLRKLYKAAKKACTGSMWKSGTALYRWDALENSVKARKAFEAKKYKLQRYLRFKITRPKARQITATRVRDRHIQRSICDNILYDRITRSFVANNGACQRNRGVDYELNRLKAGLHRYYMRQRQKRAEALGCRVEDVGPFQAEGWVYKGDVSKYFPSTPQRNAKEIIAKHTRSEELRALLCAIVESFSEEWFIAQAMEAGANDKAARALGRKICEARTELEMLPLRSAPQREAIARQCVQQIRRAVYAVPGITGEAREGLIIKAMADEARGIALGSQVSQLLQLAQLDDADHYATETGHISLHYRYMDDYLLIDEEREKVERAAQGMRAILEGKGLKENPKSQFIPLRKGIIFLKWHFYLTTTGKVIMRAAPGVAKDEKRRLRRMVKKMREGEATRESIEAHYQGWRAHMARGDTKRLLESMDKYLASLLDGEKEREKS